MPDQMVCPKCQGQMRTYERNKVTIDQCTECRGIFLDRGELEQLLDAESAYYQQTPAASPVPPAQPPGYDYRREYGYGGGHHGGGHHDSEGYGGHHKRRRGFLGELFD